MTGHTFRQGFTKAALLGGYSLQAIMVHGDWNHEKPALNSYAAERGCRQSFCRRAMPHRYLAGG